MPECFEHDTADGAWKLAVSALSEHCPSAQNSRLGDTAELLHASFNIRDPRQHWVTSRKPGMNPAFAIVEFFWILAGRNDSRLPNYWNPALPKYAGSGPTYAGAYGARLQSGYGFDQVIRAANALRTNPDSRQVVLQIWDPRVDMPADDGTPASADVPCNICAMPKLRGGKLEWLQVMRSNDIFRGTPYNFVQFMSLQEIMAGWLDVELGTFHQVMDSLHLYSNDAEKFWVEDQEALPLNEDRLGLPFEDFEDVLAKSINILEELCSPDLKAPRIPELLRSDDIPPAYRNLLSIAAADSARRCGWGEEMDRAANLNDNPALQIGWSLWLAHKPLKECV